MSSKNTWVWITVAAALFGFIFCFENYFRHPEPGPQYLLPGFDSKAVKTVQISAGKLEMTAVRTNGAWQLVEPVVYPARRTNVDSLLEALQRLTVAHSISDPELRRNPKADADYGIDPPQLALTLDSRPVYFGHRTPPGDQVFVQVIGVGGVAVVDADVLNLLPVNADAWRETDLVGSSPLTFDRITVSNAVKIQSFQFLRDATNGLWGMTDPIRTRADNKKVDDALRILEKMRVQQFLSDDPKADLESFGLQLPALTVALANGTNTQLALDFGKELTNSPGMIYARRRDQNTIVSVSTNALQSWTASYETFRDRHLVTLTAPINTIEIHGQDDFSLQWQTNNTWRIFPQEYPVDQGLAIKLARGLVDLQVADFERDSVTERDLPSYGLVASKLVRKIVITCEAQATANSPMELDFGTNADSKIFARRVGESAIYGIAPDDFAKLPSASWEMRDRRIWNFDIDDISGIAVQQGGLTRELIRKGTNGWVIAAGSQGIINDAAVEDTARELGHLSAFSWAGHGADKLAGFGFTADGYQVTVTLKNGEKRNVQFGAISRLGSYASVPSNGEPWIFEFPPDLYAAVLFCLAPPVPPAPPAH